MTVDEMRNMRNRVDNGRPAGIVAVLWMQGGGAHFSVQSTALFATAVPMPCVRRNRIGEQAAVGCRGSNNVDGQRNRAVSVPRLRREWCAVEVVANNRLSGKS